MCKIAIILRHGVVCMTVSDVETRFALSAQLGNPVKMTAGKSGIQWRLSHDLCD